MFKNTSDSYGSIAKFFHWFMAVVVIGLIIVGYNLENTNFPLLYKVHKAIGFFILLVVVARLLWRFSNIVPGYHALPKWMILGANAIHYTLYALMIVVPLAGFIASNAAHYPVSFLFLFDMPSLFADKYLQLSKDAMFIHKQAALIFTCVIGLHILAALYHHFIRKDNILKRMLPFKKI